MTRNRNIDLTEGSITGSMLLFALPMVLGNLLQQCYNLADTFIVGRCLGPEALAAVGSSYSLMTFLLSLVIGLCMGSSTLFSMRFGNGDMEGLKKSAFTSFVLIGAVTVLVTAAISVFIDPVIRMLNVPREVYGEMKEYLVIICAGIPFTFLYNFYAYLLRSIGDSVSPLWFLGVSVVLNIGLDLAFIPGLGMGTDGAALATVISQAASAAALIWWTKKKYPWLRIRKDEMHTDMQQVREISVYSVLTCLQQSVMNFGILMVQGLVNSFGTAVMAAFATAVKIDAFAYMPLQEFGNAFSTFIAQNYGAGRQERIRRGIRSAAIAVTVFSIAISAATVLLAPYLMGIFVGKEEEEVIRTGTVYLRVEGSFYLGIGFLFMLYGLFRATGRPAFSLVLTVISLGLRVLISYIAAPSYGVEWIWWAIPAGWLAADITGFLRYRMRRPGHDGGTGAGIERG